jgi:hypothetical protein
MKSIEMQVDPLSPAPYPGTCLFDPADRGVDLSLYLHVGEVGCRTAAAPWMDGTCPLPPSAPFPVNEGREGIAASVPGRVMRLFERAG